MDNDLFDLVVVGGGITGLTAAWKCQAKGLSVRVLEGRERAGGRTLTRTETFRGTDTWFDFGAHFIGKDPAQTDAWDLVEELGLQVFKQYEGPEDVPPPPVWAGEGANLLCFWNSDPASIRTTAYIGPILPESADGFTAMFKLEVLLFDMNIERPGDFPDATFYDGISVRGWLDQAAGTGDPAPQLMHDLLNMLCRVGFSADYSEISMLWFLFYLKSSGGLDEFSNVRFPSQGAQGYRLVRGAQSISNELAARIDQADAGAVVLGKKVVAADFSDADTASVHCEDGTVYHARKVLIATAPQLANQIKVFPSLPPERLTAARSMKNGQTVMTCVHFTTPFWRDDTTRYPKGTILDIETDNISRYGLSGNAMVANGTIVWTMDNVSAEGAPAMFAFVVAEQAESWNKRTESDRRQTILKALAALYGKKEVQNNFVSYEEKLWTTDPFSQGCPTGHFGPKSFLKGYEWILLDHMPPFMNNRLFFASTEAATVSNGYMSGAVWSGKAVAERIVATG